MVCLQPQSQILNLLHQLTIGDLASITAQRHTLSEACGNMVLESRQDHRSAAIVSQTPAICAENCSNIRR